MAFPHIVGKVLSSSENKRDCQQYFPISVKLLISIDRKNGEDESLETVNLATTIRTKYPDIMVGIDISGDPRLGDASWIVRVMQEARNKGLKISCHLPEVEHYDY